MIYHYMLISAVEGSHRPLVALMVAGGAEVVRTHRTPVEEDAVLVDNPSEILVENPAEN